MPPSKRDGTEQALRRATAGVCVARDSDKRLPRYIPTEVSETGASQTRGRRGAPPTRLAGVTGTTK